MRSWGLVAILLATAFAGCFGGGDEDPIGVSEEGDGTYTFRANVGADSYSWDFGDRLGRATGKTASYSYDFETGSVTVRLTTMTDGERQDYTRTIVIGEGDNTAPSLIMEAQTNWTVTGERVRFTAAPSIDPDGDNLRLTWSCFVVQETLVRLPPHPHAGGGGTPFATPPAGSGLSRVAESPIGEPDRAIEGDLCAALQQSGPGRNITIEGAFESDGLYEITLVGSDGPNPTISTSFQIWVSDPALRPEPVQTWRFFGNLTAGAGGTAQQACSQADQVCDQMLHPFSLPLVAKTLNVELSCTTTLPTGACEMFLRRGEQVVVGPSSDVISRTGLSDGQYAIEVVLSQDVQATYTVDVVAELDMDPQKYF